MPCTLTGSLDGDRAYLAQESEAAAQKKVIKLTRLLCEAMRALEDHKEERSSAVLPVSKELKRWWKLHKKIDANRIAEEERAEKRKKKS